MCRIVQAIRRVVETCCRRVASVIVSTRHGGASDMESKIGPQQASNDREFWDRVMEQLKDVPPVPKEGEIITHDRIRDALLAVLSVTSPTEKPRK